MALPININKLINRENVESERIEFKKGWNPVEYLHTACAFANDFNNWGGGYVIFGIASNNGVPELPPVGLAPESIDEIQQEIVRLGYFLRPSYTPVISHEVADNKHILVLWIPGGDNRPYSAPATLAKDNKHRKYFIRKGSSTCEANPIELQKLHELAAKVPFDDRVKHNVPINELQLPLIQAHLNEVGSALYEESKRIDFEEVGRRMNIIKGPTENPLPVNVGLLLFNAEPHNFFRGATTEIVIYKDEVGDEFTENKFSGPIQTQLRNALAFIRSNVIQEKVQKILGTERAKRVLNYPFEAIEEALSNAVYHRSYELHNLIEVNVRPDRLEVLSFPGPLPPLDNKMLKRKQIVPRDYRNRRIGDFLKELKLTEGKATGIPKIRKSMHDNGSPEPVFETDDDKTYFLTLLPVHLAFLKIQLDDYKTSILKLCDEPKSRKEILSYIGLKNHPESFARHVLPLVEVGYLAYILPHIPRSPNQKYITTEKGTKALGEAN